MARAITQAEPGAAGAQAAARVLRAIAARARLLGVLFALLGGLAIWRSTGHVARGGSVEQSLVLSLRSRGIEVDPGQVVWLDARSDLFGVRSALFVGRVGRELRDVYYADVRIAGSAVLDARALTNITRTSSADEDRLIAVGPFVAFPARVGAVYDALVVLDARGEPADLTQGWPWYAKLQNAITNLQDTGRARAFGLRRYSFVEAPESLAVSVDGQRLRAEAPGVSIVLDPTRDQPAAGAQHVELERAAKGQPGMITWVVDTVRRVPWIGAGPIEWLEHTVFGLTDRANRAYYDVVATDTAAEVKEALVVEDLPAPALPIAAQPSAAQEEERAIPGWPPAPLHPVLPDAVRGEGAWLPVSDALAPQGENGQPLFYQTFVRVDPERAFTRVYVTLWDSRQVQLGIVMGTKEPESATGETGSGEIPRDAFVQSHVVAAFNGGFQAMHGEFGMMADRRVFLPPKPYAATVAVFEDGRVGIGSWPGPGRRAWDEELANSQIPPAMIAMRQNLTSVVEGDKYNPWERWWWGAAPEFAGEQTFIPRSGLCLTREGFLAFFWGESMGPDELGKAMLATRCVRGLHLDMNGKHTGFELYRSYPRGAVLPPLGRALRATEYEGVAPGTGGRQFRARLAVATMTPIRFPRYLDRDPRDFFYLTRKPLLPGADLDVGGERVSFSSAGLPSTGFPHAFARATLSDAASVVNASVTRIDVTRAVPAPLVGRARAAEARVLATLHDVVRAPSAGAPEVALQAGYRYGRLRLRVGPAPARAEVLARGPLVNAQSSARAALGIDPEGFLVFVTATTPERLRSALAAAGVTEALGFTTAQLSFAPEPSAAEMPDAGVAEAPAASPESAEDPNALSFLAETRPPADVLFGDVKPKPYRYWGYLQDQRVRYFPSQHAARFPTPEAAR